MGNILPLFPLELVAFPGEKINLHIFEPRYKDLVNDIIDGNRIFGITPFVNNKIDFGTKMKIISVDKLYKDGRMDIRTEALGVFKLLSYENPAPDKKYAEGIIQEIQDYKNEDPLTKQNLLEKLEEFFNLIDVINNVILKEDLVSYEIIHKLGLSIELEYELLKMDKESERQEYILNYLDKVIPSLISAEKVKQMIKMNGHFKYFDPINF